MISTGDQRYIADSNTPADRPVNNATGLTDILDTMKSSTFITVAALLLTIATMAPAETIRPTGSGAISSYALSDTLIKVGGTLTIERTFVAGGTTSGLYWQESFPDSTDILSSTVTINGAPYAPLILGPDFGSLFPGTNTWRWVIDSPDPAENTTRLLAPGDSIHLTVQVQCNDIGYHELPLRSTGFYSGGQGYFAASGSDTAHVVISLDVDDDHPVSLPAEFAMSRAYPNPFNATTTIAFAGTGLQDQRLTLRVYNTLGQLVYSKEFLNRQDQGTVTWNTGSSVGSGIYLYEISTQSAASRGKLVLIK